MNNNNKYNGWTNYATWRVNLEILSDMDWYETEHVDADYLKELVENILFGEEDFIYNKNVPNARDYALAFLDQVNYHEILNNILEEKEIEKQIGNE